MSTPEAELRRGATTDPMQPAAAYGQASALNAVSETPIPESPGGLPVPQPRAAPSPLEKPNMENDRRKFLFSPTDRPNEPVTYGTTTGGRLKPPDDLYEWLGELRDAAMQPDAPAQTRALYQLALVQLEG